MMNNLIYPTAPMFSCTQTVTVIGHNVKNRITGHGFHNALIFFTFNSKDVHFDDDGWTFCLGEKQA